MCYSQSIYVDFKLNKSLVQELWPHLDRLCGGSPGNVRRIRKKYVAKDVINGVLYIHPFGLAYMNRCCMWNRLVFVLSVYKLEFKSYGSFSADL